MSRKAEKVLIGLLTDPDSMDVLLRDGFNPAIMPTEELGPVVEWCIEYASGSGKTPTAMVIKDRFDALLADMEVSVDEVPEESIEWALEMLTFTLGKKTSNYILRSMAKGVAASQPEGIHAVLAEHSAALEALVEATSTKAQLRQSLAHRFLSLDELKSQPAPEPLIVDVLDQRAVGLLYGPSGSGKTFLALDWALSVATGSPWFGRQVQQGRVLYLMGEGVAGAPRRVQAWEQHHDLTVDSGMLTVLPVPLPLAAKPGREETVSEGQRVLRRQVVEGGYALVVVDTLARYSGGLDENSNSDIGAFVNACTDLVDLMAETGGSVLVVHHSGKSGSGERGASSLLAGVDVAHEVTADRGRAALAEVRTLSRVKSKDSETFLRLSFRLEPVSLEDRRDSVVPVEVDQSESTGRRGHDDRLRQIRAYLFTEGPCSMNVLKAAHGIAGRDAPALHEAMMASPDFVSSPRLKANGEPSSRRAWDLSEATRGRLESSREAVQGGEAGADDQTASQPLRSGVRAVR